MNKRSLAILATHRATYFEALVKFCPTKGERELAPVFGRQVNGPNVLTISEAEGYGTLDLLECLYGAAWSFSLISANAL